MLILPEQNPPFGRIFLTGSSPEALKKLKIKKYEQSEHSRYIKLYLIHYKKNVGFKSHLYHMIPI